MRFKEFLISEAVHKLVECQVGDRVKFVGVTDDTNVSPRPPRIQGMKGTVKEVKSGNLVKVLFDGRKKMTTLNRRVLEVINESVLADFDRSDFGEEDLEFLVSQMKELLDNDAADDVEDAAWGVMEIETQDNPLSDAEERTLVRALINKYHKMNTVSESANQFALYYDYTGAGRGPEVIAGPFDSKKEAEEYAKEYDFPLKGDNYFIDVYRED